MNYEEEYKEKKNNYPNKKKESIDNTDESTFCLSYGSFNENENNENNNFEGLIKENQNLNLNNDEIFFELNKKNSQDFENNNKDLNILLNNKSNEMLINKESNDYISLKNLNLNRESSNIINLNNKINNKKTSNKYNKFNIQNNTIFQTQNPIFENTEILNVNVKISKDKIAIFKLRRYDDLFNTVKLFCEINEIKEELIKPIIIKSLEAMNNVYKIYNWKLNSININHLNFISNQKQVKKKRGKTIIK